MAEFDVTWCCACVPEWIERAEIEVIADNVFSASRWKTWLLAYVYHAISIKNWITNSVIDMRLTHDLTDSVNWCAIFFSMLAIYREMAKSAENWQDIWRFNAYGPKTTYQFRDYKPNYRHNFAFHKVNQIPTIKNTKLCTIRFTCTHAPMKRERLRDRGREAGWKKELLAQWANGTVIIILLKA